MADKAGKHRAENFMTPLDNRTASKTSRLRIAGYVRKLTEKDKQKINK